MNNIYQTTLAKPAIFKGIGLHSGKNSEVRVLPSGANTGVIFKRVDLENGNIIQANYQNVSSAKLCTTLENNSGAKVSTVEHLLAALYIAEIDNALIEINSEEVPIMDGSAKEFLKVLKKSNVKILTKKRNELIKILSKNNIQYGFHYPYSINQLKVFRKYFKKDKYVNAETLASEGLSLPIDPNLTNKQISFIIKIINRM